MQRLCIENLRILHADGRIAERSVLPIENGHIMPAEIVQHPEWQHVPHYDAAGALATPGLIDCHTHIVYGGQRSQEFRMRMDGKTYAEIAQAGGGIRSTVEATRKATAQELFDRALPRMLALREEGVSCVEIKSGYGLDFETEAKMLRVARDLGKATGQRVRTTFLGAHAVPQEYHGRAQDYVDFVCLESLPKIADLGLVDAVDVFCEYIAFDLAQTEQIFRVAQSLGLPIKCHAAQLSNMGAAQSAAELGALSCEHLEFLDRAGVKAMAKHGTVAVLLPGAFYFLKETHLPPIDALRRHQVPIAIATDSNPGSSPTASLRLMMSMAARFFSLTVDEIAAAVTVHAARALGLDNKMGKIAPGYVADLVLWDVEDPAELCYYFATPIDHKTMIAGQWIS